ncbi:GNAT family N-acetyltransferase [Flavimaricola marinus]|uniref:Acetyltransferase (GNAT) family protein n=1 Tax=Flavimaricola marinus TaxID=1819565 RepID=A0A238LFS8_9RHOB|nr:GNAT family N-acetyltransferase [Flavimaricola marinus]SMY08432.1 Acetyltransferase (GNAT) family protein [Flavimaricola marinus]
MEGITIRRLGPEDLDLLCAVPEGLFDEPVDREQAEAFLADPMNEIVLAFDGPLAVSMATGTVLRHPDKPPSMFVNEVGTRDSHLRRGIARAVTERLIEIARARGCKGIWLGTETDNLAALALYRSMKAEEVHGVYFGWDDAF